jgi:hypothetical protein
MKNKQYIIFVSQCRFFISSIAFFATFKKRNLHFLQFAFSDKTVDIDTSLKNMWIIFQKYVHKIFRKNKTSFSPNLNNETTLVGVRQPPVSTSLPHHQIFNKVMRSVSQGVIFSTEIVLLKNEIF